MARKKTDPISSLPDNPEADAPIARHDEHVRKFHAYREAAGDPRPAEAHGEEGDFAEDDFEAADRARENIAARRAAGIPDEEEGYDDEEEDDEEDDHDRP